MNNHCRLLQTRMRAPVKRRPFWPDLCHRTRNVIQDFCEFTTIHGLPYCAERGRPAVEHALWIVVIIGSVLSSGVMISYAYQNWMSPVAITHDQQGSRFEDMPFPAVTICPTVKYRVPPADENSTVYVDWCNVMEQLCPLWKGRRRHYPVITTDVIGSLVLAAPTDRDFVHRMAAVKELSYSGRFQWTVTEAGICYTFNRLPNTQIFREQVVSLDNNYYDNATTAPDHRIRRMSAVAQNNNLAMTLKLHNSLLGNACSSLRGFNIVFHNAGDYPRVSELTDFIALDKYVQIRLTIGKMVTGANVQKYLPRARSCYFSTERHLAYFKIYSESNCNLECLTNITLRRCDCVFFWMPRLNTTTICNYRHIRCYKEALTNVDYEKVYMAQKRCDCLPACTSLEYTTHLLQYGTSQTFFDLFYPNATRDGFSTSEVIIFFAEDNRFTLKRTELYGLTDFMASCGSLLSLFLGISTFNIIEIVYFCTFRCLFGGKRH